MAVRVAGNNEIPKRNLPRTLNGLDFALYNLLEAPLLKPECRFAFSAIRILSAAATVLLFAGRLCAQEAVQPDISGPDYSPLGPREINILQSGSPAAPMQPADVSSGTTAAPGGTLTQTPRRFQYNLSVSERTVYDDNINISHSDRQSDVYFAIEPTLSLGFGTMDSINSAILTYRPGFSFFINNPDNDAVQHIVRLQVGRNFGHMSFQLSQDVQILDGTDLTTLSDQTGHNANIDAGGRTRHNVFTTNLTASYQLTGKLFLSSAGALSIDDYSGPQIGSQNASGNLFLNYQYREKVVVGLGGTFGYNLVDTGSPNQVYEQANARIGYNPTAKTTFSATVGLEFRQFENNSRGVYVTPVYTVNGTYEPFDGTTITLSGTRRNANAGSLAGQDYTETGINLGLQQRFMRRTSLGFAVGYQNNEYFSTISGLSATRTDNYYFFEPTVDVIITRYWRAGAYYLHRQDSSSLTSFDFYDNQAGFRMVLTF